MAAEPQHREIPAGRFKAVCLKLLDEVARSHQTVTITKRGRPVAKLVPVEGPPALFGSLAGTVEDHGDLIAPIDVAWNAHQ